MKIDPVVRGIIFLSSAVAAGSTFLVWNGIFRLSLPEWSDFSSTMGGGAAVDAWLAVTWSAVSCIAIALGGSRTAVKVVIFSSSAGLISLAAFVITNYQKFETFELFGPGPLMAGLGLALAETVAIHEGFLAQRGATHAGGSWSENGSH